VKRAYQQQGSGMVGIGSRSGRNKPECQSSILKECGEAIDLVPDILPSRPTHQICDSVPDVSRQQRFREKRQMEKNQEHKSPESRRSEKEPRTRGKEETFSLSRYLISMIEKRR
jgi:cytochrome P450